MMKKKNKVLCSVCFLMLVVIGLVACDSNKQQADNWSEESASEYQKELAAKMTDLRIEERDINTGIRFEFDLKEFKWLLSLMDVEMLKGYTKELPEVSTDEIDQYNEFYDGSLVRKGENGDYEPNEETVKMCRAAVAPDAYIKCESIDGDFEIHYFKDVYYSILRSKKVISVLTDFEEVQIADIGYCDKNYSFKKEYKSPLLNEEYDRRIETWDKYTLVNCMTGETTEYIPEPGTAREGILDNIKQMFDSAKQTATDMNRENRQKMVYESVKNIMEMVGTGLSEAKHIYEDLCWTAWTDIRSVDGYDTKTKMLKFSDMFGNRYTGYLSEALTLWKTTNEKDEVIFEGSQFVSR